MSLLSLSSLTSSSYLILVVIFFAVLLIITLLWQKGVFSSWFGSGQGSALQQFSRDLTELAAQQKLDPVVGRTEELERVIQILCRRTKNNPVLIGKAGVGKTAIAEGLAQAIVEKKVPKLLLNKKVLALDLTGILAGTKYRGEFEKRLKQVADEIAASQRRIILFIDEIHTLAEAGGAEGSIDADDILKPALARGDLQVIGATTAVEYKQFIKKDVTLDRRLHPILIDEPSLKETVTILKGIRRKYEQFHKVKISDEAILVAVDLASKRIKDKSFPDKAIDLMDEASSKVSIANLDPQKIPLVTGKDVKGVMKDWRQNNSV